MFAAELLRIRDHVAHRSLLEVPTEPPSHRRALLRDAGGGGGDLVLAELSRDLVQVCRRMPQLGR